MDQRNCENFESEYVPKSDDRWEVIKTLRKDFDENGRATAVQIRMMVTDNDNLSFSMTVGVVHDDDTGERWQQFKYIPQRYLRGYIDLLTDANERMMSVFRSAREMSDGDRIDKEILLDEVNRKICRIRRSSTGV